MGHSPGYGPFLVGWRDPWPWSGRFLGAFSKMADHFRPSSSRSLHSVMSSGEDRTSRISPPPWRGRRSNTGKSRSRPWAYGICGAGCRILRPGPDRSCGGRRRALGIAQDVEDVHAGMDVQAPVVFDEFPVGLVEGDVVVVQGQRKKSMTLRGVSIRTRRSSRSRASWRFAASNSRSRRSDSPRPSLAVPVQCGGSCSDACSTLGGTR